MKRFSFMGSAYHNDGRESTVCVVVQFATVNSGCGQRGTNRTDPMKQETHYQHIAKRVKELRAERGLSQAQLAKAAGISQQVVSAVENQTNRSIQLDTLYAIAKALGVSAIALQCPEASAQFLKDGTLSRLVEVFCSASDPARDWILKVAERESH